MAGFDILYANDINKEATDTYRANLHADKVECTDVALVDPAELQARIGRPVDVVVAGTPCQGFSTLGRRNPDDPRNDMFRHLVRFLKTFRPKAFMMENVAGILSMGGGADFANICKALEDVGYVVTPVKLSASDYGVPQNRIRIFLIGTRGKMGMSTPEPEGKKVTVSEAISDLAFLGPGESSSKYVGPPSSEYQERMRAGCDTLFNHEAANHSKKVRDRFASIQAGDNWRKHPETRKRDCHKMDPNSQSRTITTLPEDLVHYSCHRIPTVRELARIQSFPDSFEFKGPRTTGGPNRVRTCCQYTQVGNAVPPELARRLFENIKSVLHAPQK